MMAADYRHIDGLENRLGRHYSRFPPFSPTPALADQSLALRKLCDAGSNRRSRVRETVFRQNEPKTRPAILPETNEPPPHAFADRRRCGSPRDGACRTGTAAYASPPPP